VSRWISVLLLQVVGISLALAAEAAVVQAELRTNVDCFTSKNNTSTGFMDSNCQQQRHATWPSN
jgi:hypothetical protein